ncbi:MAG: hypothetical protein Q8Q32_01035 [bacterium]|nr:hypothetical protein [bacterium]
MKRTTITIVIIIAAALLVFIIWRLVQISDDSLNGEVDSINTSDGANAIEIDDQNPNRLGASFDEVSLSEDGFVVIRGVVNGDGGIIMGTSHLLNAGRHNDVQVLMDLVPGREYAVFLYADDGNGIFDEDNDTLLRNANGLAIEARFFVDEERDFAGKG